MEFDRLPEELIFIIIDCLETKMELDALIFSSDYLKELFTKDTWRRLYYHTATTIDSQEITNYEDKYLSKFLAGATFLYDVNMMKLSFCELKEQNIRDIKDLYIYKNTPVVLSKDGHSLTMKGNNTGIESVNKIISLRCSNGQLCFITDKGQCFLFTENSMLSTLIMTDGGTINCGYILLPHENVIDVSCAYDSIIIMTKSDLIRYEKHKIITKLDQSKEFIRVYGTAERIFLVDKDHNIYQLKDMMIEPNLTILQSVPINPVKDVQFIPGYTYILMGNGSLIKIEHLESKSRTIILNRNIKYFYVNEDYMLYLNHQNKLILSRLNNSSLLNATFPDEIINNIFKIYMSRNTIAMMYYI